MIDDALYRISMPNETITSTVENRIQSVLSLCDMRYSFGPSWFTICLKTSPRCSKLRNWSKLAQAGASSTVSPGPAWRYA